MLLVLSARTTWTGMCLGISVVESDEVHKTTDRVAGSIPAPRFDTGRDVFGRQEEARAPLSRLP